MTPARLVRISPAHDVWVFTHAEITVPVGGYYGHHGRQTAVSRANAEGLDVSPTGDVTPRQRGGEES